MDNALNVTVKNYLHKAWYQRFSLVLAWLNGKSLEYRQATWGLTGVAWLGENCSRGAGELSGTCGGNCVSGGRKPLGAIFHVKRAMEKPYPDWVLWSYRFAEGLHVLGTWVRRIISVGCPCLLDIHLYSTDILYRRWKLQEFLLQSPF